jgi:hypothetical protein
MARAPSIRIRRARGVSLTRALEKETRELLGRRLARFGPLVRGIEVSVKDINGPRGGVDTAARIRLSVAGRPPVFVEERATDAVRALSKAATSVTRAMSRDADKQRPVQRVRRARAGNRPAAVKRRQTRAKTRSTRSR